MKNTRQSTNPKKKKAKMRSPVSSPSSSVEMGPATPEADRDRICAELAARMNAAGVRAHRTGPEVRQMIRYIESSFARAYIFAISDMGVDLVMQQGAASFRAAIEAVCPPFFRLFPVTIHYVDELAEDVHPAIMTKFFQEMGKLFALPPKEEDESRATWDQALEEEKEQQRVAFKAKCQEHYQHWKAQGHADAELFERFPEWVVAVVPEKRH